MRALLEIIAVVAVGFIIAGGLAAAGMLPVGRPGLGGLQVHYGSLALGIALGAAISMVLHARWAELPRRFFSYLASQKLTFQTMLWGLVFAAVIAMY